MKVAANDDPETREDAISGFQFLAYLAPISAELIRPDVTDTYINQPGEIWIESLGGQVERREVPDLTKQGLWRLALHRRRF